MRNELQDKLTILNKEELLHSVAKGYKILTGNIPSKNTICVLLAQIQLETGMKSCHNFNLGNIKSTNSDNYDYSFFRCNEIINGKVVWFDPPHPACRFRAFSTLDEGTLAHLTFLKNRYKKGSGVFEAIEAGDPSAFSHALKMNRYYTADEALYTRGVVNIFNQYFKMDFDPSQVDYNSGELTDKEKQEVLNNIAIFNNELIIDESFKE